MNKKVEPAGKSRRTYGRLFAWLIVLAFSCLGSCSPKQAPAVGGGTSAAAPAAAGPVVERKAPPPAVTQGVVTFLDGTVTSRTGAEWQPVSIGDIVPTSASVKTGKSSSCDIQFGKVSAIRIGPNAVIELKAISLTQGKNVVDLGLLAGAVTCKVNKLAGRDRFQVGTSSAVCAVRGTQFAVSAQEGKAMKVAVQEGGVAILPPSFDQAKLDALTNTSNESMVAAVVDSIVQSAPVVTKDQELSIKKTDMAKADTIVARIQVELVSTLTTENAVAAAAPETATAGEKPAAAVQAEAPVALSASIAQSLKDYTAAAPVSVQKTVSFSTESKRLLERGASLEVKETLPEPPQATPPPAPAPSPAPAPTPSPAPTPVSATPSPTTLALTVNATPQDAEILLDGALRGTGSVTSSFPVGARVALTVRRRGYEDYESSIQLVGESGIVKAAVLRPSELYGTTKVSTARLVSGLVAAGPTLFAADSRGAVFAFTADGTVVWSAKTENADNENSRPVLGAGLLAFAGDKALCILDASSGKQRYSLPLDASDSGLFGRRPAIAGGKLYLATSTGIKIFAADSGAVVGTIALPDDVEMTPAVVGTTLYAASVGGVFYIMDGERQSLSGQIKTSAAQPYAAAPLIAGGSAYIVDRKGLAVRIDLGSQTVAWSTRVDAGKNLNVLQDFVLGEAGLYVFAKGTIYGLSSKTGERLFDPIGGVSSAPAIEGGSLWFGTQDKKIVAVDPLTGKVRATLAAPARVVGAPVASGDLLAFPTETGEAIFVNPAVVLH
jgi:outer membrane protein assembly factor BamB